MVSPIAMTPLMSSPVPAAPPSSRAVPLIDLEFTVPEGYSGSDLVAFEWLFEGDVAGDREDAVAEHTDIDDAAQTVTVEEAPSASDAQESTTKDALSKTGGSLPAFGLAIAALLIVTGIALPLTARRS